jgi:oligopeptide transport system permease protein
MNKTAYEPIPAEKFRFTQREDNIHDEKFKTKPIGYFRDAWLRFRRNKGSLVAASVILAILVFAILTQIFSPYEISDVDGYMQRARPKVAAFAGSGFWDGGQVSKLNTRYYTQILAIALGAEDTDGQGATWEEARGSEYNPIISESEWYVSDNIDYSDVRVDSYYRVGFRFISVSEEQYDSITAWQEENGKQIIYPMIDTRTEWMDIANKENANFWYRHDSTFAPVDEEGRRMTTWEEIESNGLVDNYRRDSDGNIAYYVRQGKNMRQIRILYYNYYQYLNGHEPMFVFGADEQGYDILIRISSGILLSLGLAITVASINFAIGSLIGALEGYYGGWIDLILERIIDILSGIPFVVMATLVMIHLVAKGRLSTFGGLVFCYFVTGWIGTSSRVRTQFYRFKRQEYVLAARTLGAKDFRIMFKHIFPNALGTIITMSALAIPGAILTESGLSYLGILNFNSKNTTSLGTMLSNGQPILSTDPHVILFPAIVISLMMISFNLFGNGLRDAFNPSLRGTEE